MRILISILLVLLLVPAWSGPERLGLLGRRMEMHTKRVALDPSDPGRRRVGRLTFLGGVALTSPDRVFGGFSSVLREGDHFTLLSDGGNIVRFRLDARGHASGVRFADLPDGPGTGWEKRDRDSESMIRDPRTGDILVGFERANAIWRYDRTFTHAIRHAAPPAMAQWDVNGGPEAMVRLAGGDTIIFAETSAWQGTEGLAALRLTGDPSRRDTPGYRFAYIPPTGYRPSDAALLPDGRILMLNRRFAPPFDFSAKLTIVDPARIRAGARIQGKEIATLAAPLLHDNFEGITVAREGRSTIIWIVSDDNQLVLERTLLLKFRLEPGTP